ncbi:hypothetical protein [Paenibacillus sp. FSL F4-0243]|uniref:BC1872 family protein n=1 Tax=Paenibacillus sp. FSL F4-0243 TaxID=2954732 RepID=UPI0030DABB42
MTLTREEILAKKPGKELNEHVMRHIFNMKKDPQGASFTWVHEVDGDIVDWQPAYFSPSTNISAAWEVADKLKIAIIPQSSSAPDNLKYLARAEWDFRQNEIDVFASTAPEAISKVALLMVLKL